MNPVLKWVGAIAATLVALAIAVVAYVYIGSEAVIERRYPLPAVDEPEASARNAVERGAHLARIAGCSDCHGARLEGRHVNAEGAPGVWSSNLTIAATQMSDAEFERALRRGIAPDATSLWGMPSVDYQYMSGSDVAALRSWLRSLGPSGSPRPAPVWGVRERLAVLEKHLIPSALGVRDAAPSLDLGPRYDGGRYLARISCSECHGTDLAGSREEGAPDLGIVASYTRLDFFDLLRRGYGAHHRRVPVMHRLASVRFHTLADYEIMALYDYLQARAHAPPELLARARASEARRQAQNAADNQD